MEWFKKVIDIKNEAINSAYVNYEDANSISSINEDTDFKEMPSEEIVKISDKEEYFGSRVYGKVKKELDISWSEWIDDFRFEGSELREMECPLEVSSGDIVSVTRLRYKGSPKSKISSSVFAFPFMWINHTTGARKTMKKPEFLKTRLSSLLGLSLIEMNFGERNKSSYKSRMLRERKVSGNFLGREVLTLLMSIFVFFSVFYFGTIMFSGLEIKEVSEIGVDGQTIILGLFMLLILLLLWLTFKSVLNLTKGLAEIKKIFKHPDIRNEINEKPLEVVSRIEETPEEVRGRKTKNEVLRDRIFKMILLIGFFGFFGFKAFEYSTVAWDKFLTVAFLIVPFIAFLYQYGMLIKLLKYGAVKGKTYHPLWFKNPAPHLMYFGFSLIWIAALVISDALEAGVYYVYFKESLSGYGYLVFPLALLGWSIVSLGFDFRKDNCECESKKNELDENDSCKECPKKFPTVTTSIGFLCMLPFLMQVAIEALFN